ncbi:hypothetical protein QWY85_09105 [Neolewinella lacunae]|uniref:Sel1 repeat family protein n=1 Tax=Neolewinella lacunae TaxID=1517758 RepID=A0A923PPR9_9BACT|nr:hypothetical protein [Neolewinella lacunae]MBC6996621.1 hypothetical protein [Neolewinella lacunae]MDN3634815.1 hypothetical protein [Neolewinella lacunae]
MKKFIFFFFVALGSTFFSSASAVTSDSGTTVATTLTTPVADLCSAVADLREAKTQKEIEAAAGAFETLRQQDAGNWLTHYYAAYAYGRIAHITGEMKTIDGWVEKGTEAIQAAAKCNNADVSEIKVIEAYLDYASIRVNPMVRGFKLSSTAMSKLSSSLDADGNNPRAYLLITQHLINVPAMLGGDPEKACKYNAAAQKTYAMQEADQNRDPLFPTWGRADSDEIATNFCNETETKKRD